MHLVVERRHNLATAVLGYGGAIHCINYIWIKEKRGKSYGNSLEIFRLFGKAKKGVCANTAQISPQYAMVCLTAASRQIDPFRSVMFLHWIVTAIDIYNLQQQEYIQ